MNGRCTADPLDHADDICEFCGDEFCRSCLIHTRGRKGQQICRECAIVNSGVRGSKSTKPRPSKAQLGRAREALAEAKTTRTAKGFQFFDEEADYHADEPLVTVTEHADNPHEDQVSKRRFGFRRKGDDPEVDSGNEALESINEPSDDEFMTLTASPVVGNRRSTPATSLIESGALDLPASTPATSDALPQSETGESFEQDQTSPAASPLETPDARECPSADQALDLPMFAAGISQPALSTEVALGSLVDRLRSATSTPHQDQTTFPLPVQQPAPTAHQPVSNEANPSDQFRADPFAVSASSPASSGPATLDVSFPATQQSNHGAAASFEWQSAPDLTPTSIADDPFAGGDPFAAQPVTAPSPETSVAPEDSVRVAGSAPATPPIVASEAPRLRAADQFADLVMEIERRSVPTPLPQSDLEPRSAPAPRPPSPAVAPQPIASASASVPRSTAVMQPAPSPSVSADTDANGNWIPPLLRGMAPVAERQSDPLPKRRGSD